MKEKVIETAGKTWLLLGQNGETDIGTIAKKLNEKNEVVLQSLGWLAREDKISYSTRSNKTFVSLIESELQSFNNVYQGLQQTPKERTTQLRRSGRSAKKI